MSLFVEHVFYLERDNKPYLKFHLKRVVLLIYRIMSNMLGFGGWIADFEASGISRCFRV
jgi:hypothetical protein